MDSASAAPSRLPASLRFPLVCLLSLGLSTLFYSITTRLGGFQLAVASRDVTEGWQVAALFGWRIAELFTAWTAGYNWLDIASLSLLSNYPYYYLLYSFWTIHPTAAIFSLLTDVSAIAIPFALLRPSSRSSSSSSSTGRTTANQAIASDKYVLLLVSFLATTIYASFFYLGNHARLSVFLVRHFELASVESAYASSIPRLVQLFTVNGFVASCFLFHPAIAAAGRPALTESPSAASAAAAASPASQANNKKFHPETATLRETVAYNLGYSGADAGWSRRARVLARRTLVLAAAVFLTTAFRVFATVRGTDPVGALGWAAIWAAANLLVGLAFAGLANEY